MVKEMSGKELDELVETGKKVVCEFWAPWCGPCRMLGPIVEELSEEFSSKAEFAKVNIDEDPALAASLEVYSIPDVFIFENGEKKDHSLGYLPKSRLKEFFEKNL